MLGGFLLLLWALSGVVALYLLLDGLLLEEKLAYGLVLGLTMHALVALALRVVMEFSAAQIWVSTALVLAVLLVLTVWRRKSMLKVLREDIDSVGRRTETGEIWWLFGTLFLAGPLMIHLFFNSWRRYPDGWYAGHFYIWGDMPIHTGIIQALSLGGPIPPENIYFSGTRLNYPFAMDFVSALLIKLGWTLDAALVIPGAVTSIAFVVALYCFSARVGGDARVGALSVLLVLLSGGAGFLFFLADVEESGKFWSTLLRLPGYYTRVDEHGINFVNIILAFLLPQRPFLLGLTLGLLVFTLLHRFALHGEKRDMLVAGGVTALLPLVHPHTLLTILIVAGVLFAQWLLRAFLDGEPRTIRNVLVAGVLFGLPLVVGAPQGLLLLGSGAPADSSLSLDLGWNSAANGPFTWYWLKNTGVFIPVLLAALLSRKVVPASLRRFYLPFGLLFFLATFVRLAPFDCCNRKLLVFWYIGSAILISVLIMAVFERSAGFVRVLLGATVLLLVFSGGLDVLRASFPAQVRQKEFSNAEIEFAQLVASRTPSDAVFLTGTRVHHPVSDLAGRTVVLGPAYLLADWGIDYSKRGADVARIYSGASDAAELLRRYRVRYVVVGRPERNMYQINERYFSDRYPVALRYEQFAVYDVAQPSASAPKSMKTSGPRRADRTILAAIRLHDLKYEHLAPAKAAREP